MTDTEKRQYNGQPKVWRDAFDRWEKIHPEWNFSQCVMMATIETGIGMSNHGTIETVLMKAREYLKVNFPDTFFKVARTLDSVIYLVKRKVINTWNKIMEWFNSL